MQKNESTNNEQNLNGVIIINRTQIKDYLGGMVRQNVEETLNAMLDAEADQLCNARRYEHTDKRTDARSGHYKRKLQTRTGQVELKMPKLRKTTFETAIIERWQIELFFKTIKQNFKIKTFVGDLPPWGHPQRTLTRAKVA
ncbi:Transposase [Anaerohalosphaera lusitana]|uniref:Mutator family transposase n=1 Tax=Anaerohalosphaera lusitana TaxID=1936003 RepID=A0A1U9NLE4_9BACT|nr:transposase [Anaerohalosphaera lusitana]AQT68751.1 Transposase [Anaerohalosphaera lusitana]